MAISGTSVTSLSSGEARHLHQHAVVEGGTMSAMSGTAAVDVASSREAHYRPAAVEGGTVGLEQRNNRQQLEHGPGHLPDATLRPLSQLCAGREVRLHHVL